MMDLFGDLTRIIDQIHDEHRKVLRERDSLRSKVKELEATVKDLEEELDPAPDEDEVKTIVEFVRDFERGLITLPDLLARCREYTY